MMLNFITSFIWMKSIGKSLSWEANSHQARLEIPDVSNPNKQFRVHQKTYSVSIAHLFLAVSARCVYRSTSVQ
jgi:hypothetical protein